MMKGSAELPVSWLLSGEGELSGSSTSVGRCGWVRCLLHTAEFE